MKKPLIIFGVFAGLLLALFVAVLPTHDVSAATLSRQATALGLVAWWKMDEGTSTVAHDYSGNDNHLGLYGNIGLPSWVSGARGKGLSFDGQNQANNQIGVVDATVNPELQILGDVTVSAWIKPSSIYGDVGGAILRGGQGTDLDYSIFYSQTNKSVFFHWFDGGFPSVSGTSDSVPFDTWSHVAITRSGTTLSFYVNGVFTNSSTVTLPTVPANQISVGMTNNAGVPQDFSGAIDEMRIYNRALSASEVATLYGQGKVTMKTVSGDGLVGWWKMDEGTSTVAHDFSGKGNQGTVTSGTWVIGKKAGALSLDGSSSFVDVGANSSLAITGDMTLSAWVNPTSLSPSTQLNVIVSGRSAEVDQPYDMAINSGVILTQIHTTSGWQMVSSGAVSIPLNQWSHIMIVRSGLTFSFYKDGVFAGTGSITDPVYNPNWNGALIGKGFYGGARFFNGRIDDVRIYNRALSASEATALYGQKETVLQSTQSNQVSNGLVGYWSFNGKDMNWAGNLAYDRSGQGNNGTLLGMSATSSAVAGKNGQGIRFRGDSPLNQIGVGSPGLLAFAGSFSASVWIKTSTTTQGGIVGRYYNTANNKSYRFFVRNTGALWVELSSDGNSVATCIGGDVNDGQWHHVAVAYDSAAMSMAIYSDGVVLATCTAPSSLFDNGLLFHIGTSDANAAPNSFTGLMDEVRMYNRPLSAGEVKQLYLLGK